MNYAMTVLNQMIMMALYMLIGYVLNASGLISKEGNRGLSTFVLYVVVPCVIVNAFLREPSAETTRAFCISIVVGAILLGLAMLVGHLLFSRNPVDNFSVTFSNAGFIGIPLVTAVLGSEYVIYAAGMVALLNVLQWTYGQHILSGGKVHNSLRGLILNPMVLSLLIGLAVYFLRIPLPSQVRGCVTTILNCNAPIAMCIVGYYLRELPLKEIFCNRQAYIVSVVRLVVISLLSILLIFWMPWLTAEVKTTLLILAIAPVGANVAIYAQRVGQDHKRAVAEICLSTILSLVTMPLMILLLSQIVR